MKFLKLAFKGVLSVLLHLIGLSILLVITVALTNSGSIIGYVVFGLMVLGFISFLTDPSPKFPLRRFSIILCLVLMVPVGLSAIFLHVPDEERLGTLRETNPTEYLSEIEGKDHAKWLDELRALAPDRYALEMAKEEAARREAERKVAEEARSAAAEKQKALDAKLQTLLGDIGEGRFRQAFTAVNQLNRDAADFLAANRTKIEEAALAVIKPLPATDYYGNRDGYEMLMALRPDVPDYADKHAAYLARIDAEAENAKAERLASVDRLRKVEDKVEGITWLQHPSQPKYLNSRSTVYAYIGTKPGRRPWLRVKVQYTAEDWLFVDSVVVGGSGHKVELVSGEFMRDHNTTIWEWVDFTPTFDQVATLGLIAEADDVTIRFNGMQYHRDVTFSAKDKKALREVLEAWYALSAEG